MLDREEYIEQAHFFRALKARIGEGLSTQDLLTSVREEILATTKLPMAIDFMAGELKLQGVFGTAMAKLPHYFTPFQSFVVGEAENDRSRFDLSLALEILAREASYRAEGATPQGLFLYQFESIARNRLGYDPGLTAMSQDPAYDEPWRQWILIVRRQVGLIDVADLIYARSAHYLEQQERAGHPVTESQAAVLFGPREGRIAVANRQKDPILLFAALHRQLGYPEVPRREPPNQTPEMLPALMRRVERMEARLKLLEEEQKGGIDIRRFYGPPPVDTHNDEA
ncbi:MAG TPA: hypothetical protein VMF30_04180 [Pirellulales bacterium]|nr:hypothetical protein [Pirellulales bacterium]